MAALKDLIDAISSVGDKMVKPSASEASGIKAKKQNIADYNDAVARTVPSPKAPSIASPVDKLNKNAKFGDRPGEKRLDVSEMTKPLVQYRKGTKFVPETGPAIVHEGEAIIPAEENMFNMVHGKKAAKAPKMIDHIRIRKAKSGGHIVEHHHTTPGDNPMEEHVIPNMKALRKHIDTYMGDGAEAE